MQSRFIILLLLSVVPVFPGPSHATTQIRLVTDERLRSPDPADWPMVRRTYDAQSYSPLDQINRSNVGDLELAWVWGIESGAAAAYDQLGFVVDDGVLYLYNPGDVIQALDAASGDLRWEYRYPIPQGMEGRSRLRGGVMLYQDKVIFYTADSRIVALDAATGALVWQTEPTVSDSGRAYTYSSTGIVADGKIISGVTGCAQFVAEHCFVSAHDANDGRLLWRTYTVAAPGEPGGDSWGDKSAEFRPGGEVWITGSYDPELNLTYWSAAQAKPWHRESRGTGDAALLYTNSTLALDLDTGKIVWYYQYVPGESFDLDESFEFVLADVNGRRSGFMMGKHGVLWELDRVTGQLRRASDLGLQTVAEIDPLRGFVGYRPGVIKPAGQSNFICPSQSGVKSWRSMSYNPGTRAFYIPTYLTCGEHTYLEVAYRAGAGAGSGGTGRVNHFHSSDPENVGQVIAMDVNGKVIWSHRQRAGITSAVISTAGNLAFAGDIDRYFKAFDTETGEVLWQRRLSTVVTGFPITFSVAGRQYVAVATGWRGGDMLTSIPRQLSPELVWARAGNALFVFALPED